MSNTRRSSCDFASVAASAERKSSSFVHGTCSSAANASSSSEVPTCMPSSRSSSANSSSRGAKPLGGLSSDEPIGELHPDPLGDHVQVGAVLDDDRHRVFQDRLVDVLGAEQEEGARPVDRLGDRGW